MIIFDKLTKNTISSARFLKPRLLIIIFLFLLGGCKSNSPERHDFWSKTYAREEGSSIRSLLPTADGGFIVGGWCGQYAGIDFVVPQYDQFFCIYKLDSYGEIEWSKWNTGNFLDGYVVQQTMDGGYLAVVDDNEKIKISSSGEMEWRIILAYYLDNRLIGLYGSIKQTSDGGYVIFGTTTTATNTDMFLIKLNSQLVIEWQKRYGGPEDEHADGFMLTSDGGFFIIPTSKSYKGHLFIKLDSEGSIQWQKSLVFSSYYTIHLFSPTSDGGLIAVGLYPLEDNKSRVWLMKLDSQGEIQWEKGKVYAGSLFFSFLSIQQTLEGGYIVGGGIYKDENEIGGTFNQSDFLVLKFSMEGDIEWQRIIGGDKDDGIVSWINPIPTSDGGYLIAGYTGSFDSGSWILKLSADGTIPSDCAETFIKPLDLVAEDDFGYQSYFIASTATVADTNFSIIQKDVVLLEDVELFTKTQCTGD